MRNICKYLLLSIFLMLICCHYAWPQIKNREGDNQTKKQVQALMQDFDDIYSLEPIRAKELIQKAVHLSKSNGLPQELGDSYYRLGRLQKSLGNYDSALYFSERALHVYEDIPDVRGIVKSYLIIGNIFREPGNLAKALDYYTKGLQLARKNKIDDLVLMFINNIGGVYSDQDHYDKALQYYEEAAFLSKSGYYYAIALCNVGFAKLNLKKFDEAINDYQKSLEACQEIEDESCSLFSLNGLANVYLEQKKLGLALEVTEKLIKMEEKLGLDQNLFESYNRMGQIYYLQDQYDLAIWYHNKSLSVATPLHAPMIPQIHSDLYEAHAKNGQFEEALDHIIKFYEMRDSIYSLEYKVRVDELLTKYETEKKEKEIALLRKDQKLKEIELEKKQALYTRELLKNELKEQENKYKLLEKNKEIGFLKKDRELQKAKIINKQSELERQTFIRNIAIISAILIFVPTFILMIVYQQKVRNKELLVLKTEEVNKQKTLELLRSFEIKTIKASIEGQEKEKQRLARELHDGVAGTLAGIKMRFQALGKVLEENKQLKNLIYSLDEVYKEVRTISHHLTPPGMLQYSYVEFIKKYLTEISASGNLEIEYVFFGEKSLNELSDDVKVELYRILQELISNIIKHAKADFAEVQMTKNDETLCLIVEDRGKGFNVLSKSGGFGLNSIRSRVDALGGQLDIDSVPGRGTIVHVNIQVDEALPIENETVVDLKPGNLHS